MNTLAPSSTSTAVSTRRRPRRLAAILAVLAAVVVLSGCLNEHGQRSYDLLNNERTHRGLRALDNDLDLNSIAQEWSDHMARTGQLAHSGVSIPPGATRVAENVGYGSSVDRVHHLLMTSGPHTANILHSGMTRVGIGATVDAQGRVWITQIFAN
jgi:uncharacterized protein YkwD